MKHTSPGINRRWRGMVAILCAALAAFATALCGATPGSQGDQPLRGVMSPGGDMKEDDFKTLHEWGATLLRFQMVRDWHAVDGNQDLDEYDRWLEGRLDHFDKVILPMAVQYRLQVVLDLPRLPRMGGVERGTRRRGRRIASTLRRQPPQASADRRIPAIGCATHFSLMLARRRANSAAIWPKRSIDASDACSSD